MDSTLHVNAPRKRTLVEWKPLFILEKHELTLVTGDIFVFLTCCILIIIWFLTPTCIIEGIGCCFDLHVVL